MCEHCLVKFHDEPVLRSWIGPPMTDNTATGAPIPTLTYAPSDLRWDAVVADSAKGAIRGWARP